MVRYLEDELVRLAQFHWVLVKLFVLFDLVFVGGVEQQLLDVGWLQPVGGHVHQNLTQLNGGELQMGDEDGCSEGAVEEKRNEGGNVEDLHLCFSQYERSATADETLCHTVINFSIVYY